MKIDGEFLSNLRFADDIFLCTETPQELQQMLQELSDESRRMGLKMNIAKTKVMVVDNTPININNVLIENVQGYVYLGQHYSLKEKNQDKEIQRRIMAGWAAVLARFCPPGRNRAAEILSARAAEIPFAPSFSPMGRNC